MKEQTDQLHEAYIKKFSELKEHAAVMTSEAYAAMAGNLLKEYTREYATMDGEEGIETDKSIEALSTTADKELTELKLEHERLTAELKLVSARLKHEMELRSKVEDIKAELLCEELMPAYLPRRWWQLRRRPNNAMLLMQRELAVEIDDYFAARLNDVEEKEGRFAGIEEMLQAALPKPKGRRAQRKHNERIHEIAVRLEAMLRNAATAIHNDPDMADVYGMPE